MQTIEKVKQYVNQYHMLMPNDTVVAGVSGGADSLCLLFLLKELSKEMPLKLAVVHVNHGVREEAGEDAAYVRQICERLNVPFFLKEVHVETLARKKKLSVEEAGREARYEAFAEVLEKTAKGMQGKIAVAHTANDRAETMLFHLFRGTGLTGLTGIKPVRGQIIRPLLCMEREEAERFLNEKGIAFCIDRTNNEDTYTRNKIRHHILPFAREQICEGAVSHMNHTAEMLLETEEFLKEQTKFLFEQVAGETNQGIMLSVSDFVKQPVLLQKRLLLYCVEKSTAGRKDFGALHIDKMRSLFYQEANKEVALPGKMTAWREYDSVFIGKREIRTKTDIQPKEVLIPGKVEIDGFGVFEFTVFEYDNSKNIPQKTYTKWFDYDKIVESLVLRTKNTGDYLTYNEALSKKSLKKYFIDEKISKYERDRLYVLADGSHILWVPGYRMSQYYKVKPETVRVLQVHFRGGH